MVTANEKRLWSGEGENHQSERLVTQNTDFQVFTISN
jgi:hypothetical protein